MSEYASPMECLGMDLLSFPVVTTPASAMHPTTLSERRFRPRSRLTRVPPQLTPGGARIADGGDEWGGERRALGGAWESCTGYQWPLALSFS